MRLARRLASLLLAAGVDTKIVSTRLGHNSTVITNDLYTHVRPAVDAEAADALAALLKKLKKGKASDADRGQEVVRGDHEGPRKAQ